MNLKSKFESGLSVFMVRMFNQRIPIAVRIELSNRCPNRCFYCNIWSIKQKEMTTKQVFKLLDELKQMGTKRISFSGGEPLLRDDIGEIIDYCDSLGMVPEMNSRGFLIDEKIDKIKKLKLLKISIDGPKEVHDYLSGRKGSFEEAVHALELATKNGIKTIITVTITKQNIQYFDFLIELAKKYNSMIAFQPLKLLSRGVSNMDNIWPEKEEYTKAIAKLISYKLHNNGIMRNSLIGLKHIYHWPVYQKLKCSAGKLFCIIDTDGTVYPCDRIQYKEELPNCIELGFKQAWQRLKNVKLRCSGCGFCGSLELNFLYNFKFRILDTIFRLVD